MSKSNYDILTDEELVSKLLDIKTKINNNNDAGRKKIYFAAPWFTEKAKAMYAICQYVHKTCSRKISYSIFYPKDFVHTSPEETFKEDVKQIIACDLMIALVDDKDVGTAWEIGMAYALGKPIYLVGFDESTFEKRTNLMLAFTGKCFTVDKFHKFLNHGLGHDDFVNISKKWEDLE